MNNQEVRINIIESKDEVICAQCLRKKIKSGYENIDCNGEWFCSVVCEQKNKLYKHYF